MNVDSSNLPGDAEPGAPLEPPTPDGAAPDRALGLGRAHLISQVRRLRVRQLWLIGALYGAAALLTFAALGGFAANGSTGLGRALLILSPVAFAGVLVWFGVYRALATVGDETRAARWIDARVPALRRGLLTAVELSHELHRTPNFSTDLARAYLESIDQQAAQVSAPSLIEQRPVRQAGIALAGVAVACIALGVISWRGWVAGVTRVVTQSQAAGQPHREPITGDIELTYRYPPHTGLAARTVSGTNGEISAPKGTEVIVKTRADRAVSRAEVVVNEVRVPLSVKGERDLAGAFVLDRSGSYRFQFYRGGARAAVEGPPIALNVEPDVAPQVRLLTPAEEIEIDPGQKVTLKYEATDDFGLTGLELVFRPAGATEEQRLRLPADDGRRTQGQYTWDLGTLPLRPGDRVSYYVEAKDNDKVDGEKRGVSRTQLLKVYSAAEHRREALRKAEALWERLVSHLGDRLESPDRTKEKSAEQVTGEQRVDAAGRDLATELVSTGHLLSKERDAPRELFAALVNVGENLRRRVQLTGEYRRVFLRFQRPGQSDIGVGGRLTRAVDEEIREVETDVLYLETLLDRQKLDELKELAKQLAHERRELASLIEQYKKTNDPAVKESVLQQINALKSHLQELMQRMAELRKGIRDEHLNAEALQELAKENDMGSALDEVEKLMREGKADEALAKLQELGMQMEQMLQNLDAAGEEFGDQQFPELAQKFREFSQQLQKTTESQKRVADETRQIRDRYKEQAKERLRQRAAALRDQLLKTTEEVAKDYKQLEPGQLQHGATQVLEEAQSELQNLQHALKVEDFDLAAEAAARAERAASQLRQFADQQAAFDERILQKPPQARERSARLAERMERDEQKVRDVNEKLQQMFPQPGSMMSEQDRQRMRSLSGEQRQLEKQAQSLRRQMEEMGQMAPIFNEDALQSMGKVGERMGAAAERLDGRDPGRGHGEQRAALDQLQQLEQQMKESRRGRRGSGMPMPMFSGNREGWGQTSDQKVEIPDPDQFQAPKEFRKDLLEAMKQGAPEKYRDQVKRYYEELVK